VGSTLAVAMACGGGNGGGVRPDEGEGGDGGSEVINNKGGSKNVGNGGVPDVGGTASLGGEGGSGNATAGLAYPLTLSPLGNQNASIAHVSLYFTVTDANDEPVPELASSDFVAEEDGSKLDVAESFFRVENPQGALRIPTVLVLDLSRSVVEAKALEDVKAAAGAIIDSLDATQELAILTFAGDVTVRSPFTASKKALHAVVDAIDGADGIATNLFGAIEQGLGMWTDGFYANNGGSPQLTAGLLVAITDGNDTAGVATLPQVLNARGSKRVLFIPVGEEAAGVAEQIANAGVVDASGGFEELEGAVEKAIDRIERLNGSIYAAEYCSPKRAGDHELLFTVAGNEQYIGGGSNNPQLSCEPSGPAPALCDQPSYLFCDWVNADRFSCCPPTAPFHCQGGNKCYATAADADLDCPGECTACGKPFVDEEPTGNTEAGYAIELPFNALGFSDAQCNSLFDDGSGGAGGAGAGGAGAGGAGPTVPGANVAQACEALAIAMAQRCAFEGAYFNCGTSFYVNECEQQPEAGCESQFVSYLAAQTQDIKSFPANWSCPTLDASEAELYCTTDKFANHPYLSCN
jgi:hypothetical protein